VGFPHFATACGNQDFAEAAANCAISENGNPGVAPRNRANRTLFRNAAVVVAGGSAYDPAALSYPTVLGG
jgi:hypothetical protein